MPTRTSSSESGRSVRDSTHHKSSSSKSKSKSKGHSQSSSHSSTSSSEDDQTNYRILRNSGYDNIHHFMLSYGLKPYDPDDYQTAKQLIQEMRHNEGGLSARRR